LVFLFYAVWSSWLNGTPYYDPDERGDRRACRGFTAWQGGDMASIETMLDP
jgi:hypothetical protein